MEKNWKKVGKRITKEIQRQEEKFKMTCKQFYPEGTVTDFRFPAVGDYDTFGDIYERSLRYSFSDKENREDVEKRIIQIHQNVREGKAGNFEVHFDKGMIQFGNSKYGLANAIAMIRLGPDCEHVFFKEGDRYGARVFIEAASKNAFFVLGYDEKDKNNNKDTAIILLDEFYLLGSCCNEKSGIMVGYDWAFNNIYCDLVEEVIFNPIKELLVADWLQEEWEKTKETNEKGIESISQ